MSETICFMGLRNRFSGLEPKKTCPKCGEPLEFFDGGLRGAYYYCSSGSCFGYNRWEYGEAIL